MNAAEMRLWRVSLRLRPVDIAAAIHNKRPDVPTEIVKGWERSSSRGPPEVVARFLRDADNEVSKLANDVALRAYRRHRDPADIEDRHGDDAAEDLGALAARWLLTADALQSLHATAWDRAFLSLRWAVGLDLVLPGDITSCRV